MPKSRALPAILLPLALCVAPTAAPAENRPTWQAQAAAGAVHRFETSLDSGGDASVDRWFLDGSLSRAFGDRWRTAVSLGYGEDRYDFSGATGFGGLDPWDRIRQLRIGASLRYAVDDRWTLYAIPSLRFNAESGASLSDGDTLGLIAGATYRFSDDLRIGPGLGVFSELEDDASYFPVLLIDWQISQRLSFQTGGGSLASRGPGLQLRWRHSPRWQFALGARYAKTRFRLDDSGPAPRGVGEDKSIPVFAQAELAIAEGTRLTLVGGVELDAGLRLEDSSGDLVSDTDASDAPFLGALLQIRF